MNHIFLFFLVPIFSVDPEMSDGRRRMSSASSEDIAESPTEIEPRIIIVQNSVVPELRRYRYPNDQPELVPRKCITICIIVCAFAVLIWFISKIK